MTGASDIAIAKRRVSEGILGRHGVHGVGTAGTAGEVVLRVDPKAGGLPDTVLREAALLARPFGLRVVEEPGPELASR